MMAMTTSNSMSVNARTVRFDAPTRADGMVRSPIVGRGGVADHFVPLRLVGVPLGWAERFMYLPTSGGIGLL